MAGSPRPPGDFSALNPQAASFVPQPSAGAQSVAAAAVQPPQQSDDPPVQQRRRRTRRKPPVHEQVAAASRTHPEEDWRLPAQQPAPSGRRRGRRRQAVDNDAWSLVPSEAGATEDWSVPSVGTTAWVSVAASVVDDLAVDAMAADDDAYGTTAAEVMCTVCVEPIVLPGKLNGAAEPAVCMRGCAHVFHRGCLIRWLSTHPSCPNCRTPAAPEPSLVRADAREQGGSGGGRGRPAYSTWEGGGGRGGGRGSRGGRAALGRGARGEGRRGRGARGAARGQGGGRGR